MKIKKMNLTEENGHYLFKGEDLSLKLTHAAFEQLLLFVQNLDLYPKEERFFRFSIDGKECSGFLYAFGVDKKNDKDFIWQCNLSIENALDEKISFIMDPFSAFYLKEMEMDYLFDDEEDLEGFLVVNKQQDLFKNKFFTQEEALVPDFSN